jgi:hypothetical protein
MKGNQNGEACQQSKQKPKDVRIVALMKALNFVPHLNQEKP